MLEKLKEISESLNDDGKFEDIEVIREIWNDGGGAPVYLEDVISYLETL